MKEQIFSEEPQHNALTWMRASSSFFMVSAVQSWLSYSDILFVSLLIGNSKAGIYAAARILSALAATGFSITEQAFTSKTIAALTGPKSKVNELLGRARRMSMMLIIPLAVILALSGKPLLMLSGAAFSTAYVPLLILLAGHSINSLFGISGNMMNANGRRINYLLFSLLAASMQLVLNFTLIPVLGISGAAISTVVAMIVLNVLCASFLKKKQKLFAAAQFII